MNKTVSRVLWVLAGVLLIAAGVVCFARPGAALDGISWLLGFVMLASGVVDIVIFASAHDVMFGSGWFLLDGVLTILLSIFVLCNQWFTVLTLPFILGMWLLFSGVGMFVDSFDLHRLGVRGWGWFTALGIVEAVCGFLSFCDPLAGAAALAWMVGVFLILQGVAAIVRGCFTGRFWM